MKKESKDGFAGDCTTPAENTGKKHMRALVDWVTCSFRSVSKLHQIDEVFNLIGIGDLSNLEVVETSKFSKAGYTVTYKIGMIEWHRNFDEERWLLNMSGQGCRQYEIMSNIDLLTMFAILSNLNTSFTRLDIAVDDFSGIYSTNVIRQAVYNKQCVSRLEDWGTNERGKIAHGRDLITMDNFYLGNSKSRYFINVYDKKLERIQKFKTAGDELRKRILEELNGIDTWTRTEVRFKDEYAEQFVGFILSDHFHLGFYITAFLNDKIKFLKKSVLDEAIQKNLENGGTGKINKSRLAKDYKNHCRWWRSFIHHTHKLHLSVYKPDKMLAESKDWLYNQVSTTLAQWAIYRPLEFYSMIDDLVEDGLSKFKESHVIKIKTQQYFDKLAEDICTENEENIKRYPTIIRDKKKYSVKDFMNIYNDVAIDQDQRDRKDDSIKKSASFGYNETDSFAQ